MSKKWEMNRRAFLRASGYTIFLPMLDVMMPSIARAADGRTRRLMNIYIPNGALTDGGMNFHPTIQNVLNTIRADLTIVNNIRSFAVNGDHEDHMEADMAYYFAQSYINSIYPAGRKTTFNVNAAFRTMDQYVAQYNPGAKLGPIGMSVPPNLGAYASNLLRPEHQNSLSWIGPGQANRIWNDPQSLFNQLFSSTMTNTPTPTPAPNTPAPVDPNISRRGSLHYVMDQITALRNSVGKDDQIRLDEYFTGVDALEKKIAALGSPVTPTPTPVTAPITCERPNITLSAANYQARMAVFYDIAYHAFKCDITRAISCIHATEGNEIEHSFVPGIVNAGTGWHALSHYEGKQNPGASFADLQKLQAWHHQQIVNFVNRLRSTVQPNGQTLLDETAVVWGSGMSSHGPGTAQHDYNRLRICLAGGGNGLFKKGQTVNANNVSLGNLWLTISQAYGATITSYGNSTGTIPAIRV